MWRMVDAGIGVMEALNQWLQDCGRGEKNAFVGGTWTANPTPDHLFYIRWLYII